jgi:alkylation response protein AidB-like acyl-CoA dehydrogenase
MDLRLSPSEEAFRDEVRDWLQDHVPRDPRPDEGTEMTDWDQAWQRAQFDAGYAGIAWPAEYGGRGMTIVEQLIWYEEYARAGGPYVGCNFVGLNHGGPTLIARGSEQHKATHLAKILRGEEIWCQGFSEPGAGSDLGSLKTAAHIDGDELVVNGQKIWTSYADVADYQELLVRTDNTGSKHHGITWVINDMRAPGVDVRPIRTLYGPKHYAEVFYDNVRIPLTQVVGQIDDGWSVAMSTLGFERGTAFMQAQTELSRTVERLVEMAGSTGRLVAATDTDGWRDRLGQLRAEVAAMRAMTHAGVARTVRSGVPGPEGSMIKLYFGELVKRVYSTAMDLRGIDALEIDGEYTEESWVRRYLRSYATTVAAGTSEIQRNIISERVLGLPR